MAVRRTQESTPNPDDMDAADDDNAGTALYAPYQTILYTAPAVVNGRVPKNIYGNLDVYVPTMVPAGGAHIPHPETARAAKTIGIDCADAITGFSFKGRHGTAITNGAVVAAEFREAVEEVIKAFEDERAQAEEERRSLAALKMWKRFLAGLRIRERIEGYDIEGERDMTVRYEMEQAEDEDEDEDDGGGFLPDRNADEFDQPTGKAIPARYLDSLETNDEGGGFCVSEDEEEEIEAPQAPDRFVNMVHDDDDEDGGGFELHNDEQNARRKTSEADHQEISHGNTKFVVHASAKSDGQEIPGQEGGFLPDDRDTNYNAPPADDSTKLSDPADGVLKDYGSIDPQGGPPNEEHLDQAFPNLPVGELEEARILQQFYESQGHGHLPVSKEDVNAPAPCKSPDSSPIRETAGESEPETSTHPIKAYPSSEPVVVEDAEPDSSEDDKGSLLSHDPDDEDADPEWLA